MKIREENDNRRPDRRSKHGQEGQPVTGGSNREAYGFAFDNGLEAERRGDLQTALKFYAQAVSIRPDSARAWYNYGDVLLAMGRHEEAISPLTEAVELKPGVALYRYDLGLAFFNLDRFEEASREFAGIVGDDPQLKRASSNLVLSSLTQLALTQDKLGRSDEAANTLAPALQFAVDILYNLGLFKWRAERAAEAIDLLQAAALLCPESVHIIHLLGSTLLRLKRGSEAAPFLIRATKLDPGCAGAWYDLACLYALEGKPNAAFDNLEKAVTQGFLDVQHFLSDDDLRSLHQDPRWTAIVARISERADDEHCRPTEC